MLHQNNPKDLWFWRDASGNEIDLIVDKGDQMDIIEFKASQTIKTQMFDGLTKFEEISQIKNLNKSIVYGGDTTQKRSAGNLVSWREFGF